jgi:transcriptional regulator with XRE-family HTH domain
MKTDAEITVLHDAVVAKKGELAAIVWPKVDRLLKTKRWKVADLARVSTVPHATLSRWKDEQNDPDLASLRKVARALGATVDQLAGTLELALPDDAPAGELSPREERVVEAYRDPDFRKVIDALLDGFYEKRKTKG